jgi:tetratricopeptide (TPR) repeat protein
VLEAPKPTLELAIESEDDRAPPQPADWSGPAQSRRSMRLVGAGLGLWALREVPLVDRAPERDVLWQELAAVRLERAPRAIVLRGGAGCGKSRLAAWLGERAHEVGAAELLATSHQAVPDRRHGLARLIERHFRCGGLTADSLLERLEQQLRAEGVTDPYEWRALAGVVLGESAEQARVSIAPTTPTERNVLLARMIARAARDRPVIVWLDDVQWGEAGLALVQHVLASEEKLPALFVLTVRDEALAERARERAAIDAVEASARARRVRIGVLPRTDLHALLEGSLGFGGDLAKEVEARVDGHPLFALQIVGDWIDRGLLEVSDRGFVLKPGARTELPDDLHALWIGRVDQVLSGRSGRSRQLVELAAVLGSDVEADEFAAACVAMGTRFPPDLLEPLILHRLIVPSETGWSFAHNLLREALVRSAREAGHLAPLHQACARMLGQRQDRPHAAERLAHHLLGAGETERALEPLLAAAKALLETSELTSALGLIDEHERACAQLGILPTDPRPLRAAIVRAEAHRLGWDFDAAERIAQEALDVAMRALLALERADATTILAQCARQKGDLALAMSRNRTALGLYDRIGDGRGRARTLLAMAAVARSQSDLERSRELYERALAVFETLGDAAGRAASLIGLGNLMRATRRLDEARAHYTAAREICERLGNQTNLAHCVNGLAEIARFGGALDEAERGYREVLRIQTSVGSKATFIPRTNLGIVLLARREFGEARRQIEVALAQIAGGSQRGYVGMLRAFLLPCLAAARDVAAFDESLASAVALLRDTSTNDPDVATAAELAGRVWIEAGERARATAVFALAHAQWIALGEASRAEAIRPLLA